jgi:capsular polysaccharide biosynthesis protein
MNEQALDLKRSLQIVRRHWRAVCAAAVLGLIAGAVYAQFQPPALTSTALVRVASPQSAYTANGAPTLVVLASSDPVLSLAQPHIRPPVSKQTLLQELTVKSPTPGILSIRAWGQTAAQAEATANAVAEGFVKYSSLSGATGALVLQPASTATGRSLAASIVISGGIGLLVGAALGVIGTLAVTRRDRRLRQRDEIADSIGIPVLASVPVGRPSDAAAWVKLLTEYEPPAAGAWRLREVLNHLGVTGADSADGGQGDGTSLAVLSLRSDPVALALGPQLAVFAASLGIRTHLIIGPQQELDATATLREACTRMVPGEHLRVTVQDEDNIPGQPPAALTILPSVVDQQTPRVADRMRETVAVLGVSAGAATADELARVVVSAADDGRQITGILVGNPDSADCTTGRIPQLTRTTAPRAPTHLTGITTETLEWMTQTRWH